VHLHVTGLLTNSIGPNNGKRQTSGPPLVIPTTEKHIYGGRQHPALKRPQSSKLAKRPAQTKGVRNRPHSATSSKGSISIAKRPYSAKSADREI